MSISKAFVAAGVGSVMQGFRDQGIHFNLLPKLSIAASACLALQSSSFSAKWMNKGEAENNGSSSRKLREESSLRRVMYLTLVSLLTSHVKQSKKRRKELMMMNQKTCSSKFSFLYLLVRRTVRDRGNNSMPNFTKAPICKSELCLHNWRCRRHLQMCARYS